MGRHDEVMNPKCWVIESYLNLEWKEFTEFPPSSQADKSPVICLPNGFMVLCGGDTLTKNTMYDADTKLWQELIHQ